MKTETPRMHKYGESKTTRIMMVAVHHVTAWAGSTKYQAAGFLLNRVYIITNLQPMHRSRMCGGTPPLLHTSLRLLNKYKDKLTFILPYRPVYIHEGYEPQLQSSPTSRSQLSLVCLATSCTGVRTKLPDVTW